MFRKIQIKGCIFVLNIQLAKKELAMKYKQSRKTERSSLP